jgi:hypothetical protein
MNNLHEVTLINGGKVYLDDLAWEVYDSTFNAKNNDGNIYTEFHFVIPPIPTPQEEPEQEEPEQEEQTEPEANENE